MNIQSTLKPLALRLVPSKFRTQKYHMCAWWCGVALLVLLLTWSPLTQIAGDLGYLTARQLYVTGHPTRALWLLQQIAHLPAQRPKAAGLAEYIVSTMAHSTAEEQPSGDLLLLSDNMQPDVAVPDTVEDEADYAVFYNNWAILYRDQVDAGQTLAIQQQSAAAAPDVAIPHYNLGMMLWQQGDRTGAIRALREATYIEPTWALPYVHLAFMYLVQEDYVAAEEQAQAGILLAPDDALGNEVYLQALLAQSKGRDVLEALPTAQVYFDNERLQLYRALALRAAGDQAAAKLALEILFVRTRDQAVRHRVMVELQAMESRF